MEGADAAGLMRIKSVGLSKAGGRKPCTLPQAARHNLRADQDERGGRAHINPSLTHLNEVIAGPSDVQGVLALARERMLKAGVNIAKLRRDHVQAIELLFSLPANSSVDDKAFFMACRDWAARRFDSQNLLSGVIHHDEPVPHCHLLVLPLVGDRMAGGELKRAPAVAAMRTSFFDEVATSFGLSRGRERLTGAQRRALADTVLTRLNAIRDPCMSSVAWQVIRDTIEANPAPYAAALGLVFEDPAPPEKRLRTMAQIFTSPGKGAKREKPERT